MENTNHLTPVEICIREYGGVRKLAKAMGIDPAAVSRWKTRGTVPAYIQKKLLLNAKMHGFNISAEDLIFGRPL